MLSSVNISIILVGIFGTLKGNDPSVVQETPMEKAEAEAQTDTTVFTPVEKVDSGYGLWFKGGEVYSSKGPLGKLGLDRTGEEWDFPLSVSTICLFKKYFEGKFRTHRERPGLARPLLQSETAVPQGSDQADPFQSEKVP